jgi:hypothetical protein
MIPTKNRIALLSAVAIVACGGDATPTTPISNSAHTSAAALTYLTSALDIMQANSYYRSKLDWKSIRANAVTMADSAAAQKASDTYPTIRAALVALGDHHSRLIEPPASASASPRASATPSAQTANVLTASAIAAAAMHPADSLDGELIGGHYGYLRVPTFFPPPGGTSAPLTAFADTLQALIKTVDASNPCGWVVDVRHNLGGNIFSMFAGIGPIVGEGTNLGGYVYDSGVKNFWFYTAGVAGYAIDETPIGTVRVDRTPYTLHQANPPVAILTDNMTASAGEGIVVEFRGRPATRSFGAATNGVPTANGLFALSDGAYLLVMQALDADRNGNQYIDPIPPDEAIPTTAAPATNDAVVSAATAWLSKQTACSSGAALTRRE